MYHISKDPSKMRHTFSFKAASRHSHKMASKYSAYHSDDETFEISNGWEKDWMNLSKKDLMTIPWIKEIDEVKDANEIKLFIDNCLGFDIKEISEWGSIILKDGDTLRIAKNTCKPDRYQLTQMYRDKDGLWKVDSNYPRYIRSATVSANFGTMKDGWRVFYDGEKKYMYNNEGKERLAIPPVYDDYYCSCCHDYDWD